MRPLIPKVQVGSILYGTKNLRNWLRKSSLLTCLEHMHQGYQAAQAKKFIFTPQKDDEYIVAVNAWGRFAVWSPKSKVVLVFINRDSREQGRPRKELPPALAVFDKTIDKATGNPDTRMDPSIFPSWFINTNKRHIDLRGWPGYAYHLWASLHMNAISSNSGQIRLVPNFSHGTSSFGAFQYHESNEWEKYDTQVKLVECLKRGVTRRKYGVGGGRAGGITHKMGILLSDLDALDKKIKKIVDNPRFPKTPGVTVDVKAAGDVVILIEEQ